MAWKMRNGNGTVEILDLSPEQVYALSKAFSTSALKEWVLCEEGQRVWQALNEVEWETFIERTMVSQMMSQDRTEVDGTESISDLQFVAATSRANARQYRRFHKRLMLRFIHGNKTYEHLTADISMGGIHVAAPLPPGLSRVFNAFLIRNGETIRLTCSIVSSSKTKGTNLKIEAVGDRERLNRWLIQI